MGVSVDIRSSLVEPDYNAATTQSSLFSPLFNGFALNPTTWLVAGVIISQTSATTCMIAQMICEAFQDGDDHEDDDQEAAFTEADFWVASHALIGGRSTSCLPLGADNHSISNSNR